MTNSNSSFSLKGRLRSFACAIRGLRFLVASQKNALIHAVATAAVCILGLFLGLTATQWALIVVAIVAVWVAEALNTSLELLADAVAPEFSPLVGRAKDVAAGGVLVAAVGAVVIGILVLGPRILERLPW